MRTGAGSVPGAIESFFVQNGGNFSYEALPWAMDKGLLEGATPECRGPSQLLVYQRAQEKVLLEGLRCAQQKYAASGVDIGILKNCRDAFGHTYGAQENYEVEVARGAWLLFYRISLVLLAPISLLLTLVNLAFLTALLPLTVPLFIAFIVLGIAAGVSSKAESWLNSLLKNDRVEARLIWFLAAPLQKLAMVLSTPLCVVLNAFAFRHLRFGLTPFLVSRIVFSGAGSLEKNGSFILCEKASEIHHESRVAGTPAAHSIFDTGHFIKRFAGNLRWFLSYRTLFARSGRMQVGLSDSNRCQLAEYLRWGTTCLVVDMLEAGALTNAPRLAHPLQALRAFNADPTLSHRATLHSRSPVNGAETISALELQRWYLEQAKKYLKTVHTVDLEAKDVLRVWEETLSSLEDSPESLIGSVDWITKRWLISTVAGSSDSSVQKKVDLKYHELGEGYFDRLESEGLAPKLVTDEEVERAILTPPAESPAQRRGELIRTHRDRSKIVVGWTQVRIGGALRGRVVQLSDHRRK